MEKRLTKAYSEAKRFAESHYENFPVISKFLPSFLREHVAVIYKFARDADDIADEGEDSPTIKLNKLNEYELTLNESLKGNYENDYWAALHNTIRDLHLTPQYFYDLLKAFKQDVQINRYKNFNELLGYCKNSANPVGRLILELHGIKYEMADQFSDKICTALQLTNFYQDVKVDADKNRIYIPLDELGNFGVKEEDIINRNFSHEFASLLKYQADRTRDMFVEGRKLLHFLPRKLKVQIKWTILGGETVLKKIEKLDFNVLAQRPHLTKFDYFYLMLKAMI